MTESLIDPGIDHISDPNADDDESCAKGFDGGREDLDDEDDENEDEE